MKIPFNTAVLPNCSQSNVLTLLLGLHHSRMASKALDLDPGYPSHFSWYTQHLLPSSTGCSRGCRSYIKAEHAVPSCLECWQLMDQIYSSLESLISAAFPLLGSPYPLNWQMQRQKGLDSPDQFGMTLKDHPSSRVPLRLCKFSVASLCFSN